MSRPFSYCHLTFHCISLEKLRSRSSWRRVGPAQDISHSAKVKSWGLHHSREVVQGVAFNLKFGLFQEKLEHNGLSAKQLH